MNNPMSLYVGRLAEAARNMCNEKNITSTDQRQLDESTMQKIISFYKGTLQQFSKEKINNKFGNTISNSFLQKQSKDGAIFTIGYVEYSAIDILHELGHAFLELANMNEGDVRWVGDTTSGLNELDAFKFARAFLMPTKLFQETVVSCSNMGVCNIEDVAIEFAVDTTQVVCRGRESCLWE